MAYLAFVEYGVDAVEHIEGTNNMALHEYARQSDSSRPPPSAERHLEEPLLQWELANGTT